MWIFHRDVNHVARFLQRHAASCLRIKFRARESAEAAVGVADVRDGKLPQIAPGRRDSKRSPMPPPV